MDKQKELEAIWHFYFRGFHSLVMQLLENRFDQEARELYYLSEMLGNPGSMGPIERFKEIINYSETTYIGNKLLIYYAEVLCGLDSARKAAIDILRVDLNIEKIKAGELERYSISYPEYYFGRALYSIAGNCEELSRVLFLLSIQAGFFAEAYYFYSMKTIHAPISLDAEIRNIAEAYDLSAKSKNHKSIPALYGFTVSAISVQYEWYERYDDRPKRDSWLRKLNLCIDRPMIIEMDFYRPLSEFTEEEIENILAYCKVYKWYKQYGRVFSRDLPELNSEMAEGKLYSAVFALPLK